jgi:hypothetical protein
VAWRCNTINLDTFYVRVPFRTGPTSECTEEPGLPSDAIRFAKNGFRLFLLAICILDVVYFLDIQKKNVAGVGRLKGKAFALWIFR